MDTDGKLDVLLKLVEGNEKKRVEADERTRAEYQELKKTVESRIPVVEKKVEELSEALLELNLKVNRLEGQMQRTVKEEVPQGKVADPKPTTPSGMRDLHLFSSASNFGNNSSKSDQGGEIPMDISANVPPMVCPQFNGDNPQMWKSNCEQYFEVYGTHPINWVKIATLNFVGNAAFWMQSVRSQLQGITWVGLCELVRSRFAKDRHQALIRQWIHISQTGSVSEYVEKFDGLMHQLMAYDSSLVPVYFVTKFVEGLKDEIRVVVMVQRPQDLDSACAIALLQEEALEGVKASHYRRSDPGVMLKTNRTGPIVGVTQHTKNNLNQFEDRRGTESARAKDDKVAALRAYRRSKGLCFVCGERWGKEHKCATTV